MNRSAVRKTFPPRPAMPMRGGVPDVAALLARSRAEFGDAQMRTRPDTDPDDDDDPPPPPDPTAGLARDANGNLVIPQDTLNRLLAEEKRQGRRAAARRLLERAGVKDENELKELLEKGRAATAGPPAPKPGDKPDDKADPEKEELRRQLAEAERKAEQQAEEARKAAERAHTARLKAALRDAGVSLTDKGRVPNDVLRMIEVAADADDEDVDDAVDELKTRWPALFTGEQTVTDGRTPPAPTSHGRTAPPPPAPVTTGSLEAGRQKARQRLGLDKQPAGAATGGAS